MKKIILVLLLFFCFLIIGVSSVAAYTYPVKLVSPVGGEKWIIGQNYTVTWDYVGTGYQTAVIYLGFSDGGMVPLASVPIENESYTFTLTRPSSYFDEVVPGDYLISIYPDKGEDNYPSGVVYSGKITVVSEANQNPSPINGKCGGADGKTFKNFDEIRTAGTCAVGIDTGGQRNSEGAWYWSCKGSLGGTDASCKASIYYKYPSVISNSTNAGWNLDGGYARFSWESFGVQKINIDLCIDQDPNRCYVSVAKGLDASKIYYDWYFDPNADYFKGNSLKFSIKISDSADPNNYDYSSYVYFIPSQNKNYGIKLTSPVAGQTWTFNENNIAKWEYTNLNYGNISLYFNIYDDNNVFLTSCSAKTDLTVKEYLFNASNCNFGSYLKEKRKATMQIDFYGQPLGEDKLSSLSQKSDYFTLYPASYSAAACGLANGKETSIMPTSNLCINGTASMVSTSGPWSWICKSQNGGADAYCSAGLRSGAINGACGSANTIYESTDTSFGKDLFCYAGTVIPSSVSFPTTGNSALWSCSGINGGAAVSCMAQRNSAGSVGCGSQVSCCGSSANVYSPVSPTSNYCANGGVFIGSVDEWNNQWTWQCNDNINNVGYSCFAPKLPSALNGVCGSANGTTVSSAPTVNLCSVGKASSIYGSGPWDWVCNGVNGGVGTNCSAKKVEQKNCGTVDYSGVAYNTILIENQCWLKENLNVGTMLSSPATTPVNNNIIEKWCNGANGNGHSISGDCSSYGGLYAWDEAMGYSTVPGAQGICPAGWHIPTNNEWIALESNICTSGTCATDFPYNTLDLFNPGTDEGTKISTFTNYGKGVNSSGFTALFSGYRHYNGLFYWRSVGTDFWTSSEIDSTKALTHGLYYQKSTISQVGNPKNVGYSVRCIKNTNISINGVCGSTNGTTVPSVPTANLCSSGTASTVSGSGPWAWTCSGTGGGTSVSCSANKAVEQKQCSNTWDPVCGMDNRTYLNSCFADNANVYILDHESCENNNSLPIGISFDKLTREDLINILIGILSQRNQNTGVVDIDPLDIYTPKEGQILFYGPEGIPFSTSSLLEEGIFYQFAIWDSTVTKYTQSFFREIRVVDKKMAQVEASRIKDYKENNTYFIAGRGCTDSGFSRCGNWGEAISFSIKFVDKLVYVKKQGQGFEIEIPNILTEETNENEGEYEFYIKDRYDTGIVVGKIDVPNGSTFEDYINEELGYFDNIEIKTYGNKQFTVAEYGDDFGYDGFGYKLAIFKIDDKSFYCIGFIGGQDFFNSDIFNRVLSSFIVNN